MTCIVAAVAEWYRHRIVAGFVTSSSPVPLKTRREGQRCTLNLSRAKTSSRCANRSSRIVTGGKVQAAKRLPRKSHTCSMGLRSGIVPANPYVQNPHSLKELFGSYCAMTWCIVVHERNCRPMAPLRRPCTYGRRISLQ
ncbi:hypothetical protein TNCV_96861 [Trichonephila clavipes]|nr:hypothetical protein TNCV_96861 [Trichonephila clavipes]